ncbi:MAG: hypothetical protein H3C50_11085 [Kiritimatiellae bacterium]|nr:hypothetical protein [Kiritimatiellia bacterium]MCO5044519.1 hypothetical protein [Kiritimatiellia bacterium]MCO5061570.1 hypothetical protein [Kiritimatiellia bacterium]MCO5067355.1 hypothetical protein [Kiritimatiellia bacterium]
MLRIVLAWLILALVCQGFGFVVQSVWRLASGEDDVLDGWSRFWMGFCLLIAVLLLLNFVIPLTAFACGAVALISGIGFLGRCSRSSCAMLPERPPRERAALREVLFWGLAATALALLAMKSATWRWNSVYDTDLYHFSWVRLAKEHTVVPGIANLHCRLGMTYGGLLFAAFVDHGLWAGRSAWVVPGFALGAALLQWLHLLIRETHVPRAARIVGLFTFPYLVGKLALLQPTLYTDSIAHLFLLVASLELLRRPPAPNRPWTLALRVPLALVAAGFAIKALSAPALFVLVCVAAIAWLVELRATPTRAVRRALALLALPSVLVLSVLARNAITSGWPLYPSPMLPLSVDWAVPREPIGKGHEYRMQSVEGQYRVLKGWARRPGPHYGKAIEQRLSEWWPRWARHNWRGVPRFTAWAGLACASLWLLSWPWRRRFAPGGSAMPALILLLASGCSLLFWLFTAPDLRFGMGFFWLWFGAGAALLFERLPDRLPVRIAAFVAMLAIVGWMKPSLGWTPKRPWWEIGHSRSLPVKAVALGGEPPLTVYAPVEGDQCGDAPLPCTPYPLPELRARDPGNWAAGLYLQAD